jgi:hypothetical protein
MKNEKGITDLTPNEETTLEILSDFADGLEAAAVNIKRQIAALLKVNEEPTWDPNKIKWEQTEGSKGQYEKSEDFNSTEFKAMLKDLAAHQGKLSRDGYFFWVFQNGATVGRKKRHQT